jgi:hypothetical protein
VDALTTVLTTEDPSADPSVAVEDAGVVVRRQLVRLLVLPEPAVLTLSLRSSVPSSVFVLVRRARAPLPLRPNPRAM